MGSVITIGGKRCEDAGLFRSSCYDQGIPTAAWEGRANRFTCPAGREPGTGFLLLRRSVLDSLDPDTDHELRFKDDTSDVKLKRITLVRSQCLTPADPDEGNRVYLVEVADRRVHLRRRPLNKSYNVVEEAGTSPTYYSGTTNGGTAWTWQQMVTDLWTEAGLSGTPTLPYTPHGTPHNFVFAAANAWDALNDVLDRLALVADYDPLADTFAVLEIGSGPTAEASALARLAGYRLTWDADPKDFDRGVRPEKVRVVFAKHPAPSDGTPPAHAIDKTLPTAAGVVAGTVAQVFDDLVLSSSPSGSELSAADARATERKDKWLQKWLNRDRRILRVYRDNRSEPAAVVGATATAATWEDRGGGLRTELLSRPDGALERFRPGAGPVTASPPPPPPASACGVPWPFDKAALKQQPKAFLLRLTGKYGRCSCMDLSQTPAIDDDGGVPFYLCYVPTIDKWRGIKRLRGCCENTAATITLDFVTNWTVQGNLLDETVAVLTISGACDGMSNTMYFRIQPCTNGKIPLVGGGAGMCTTSASEDDCNHEFVGTLECVDEPDEGFGVTCDCGLCTPCCRTGQAPLLWEASGNFTGDCIEFERVLLEHDEACDWSSTTPIAHLGWVPEDGKVYYQACGHTWEIDEDDWVCCGTNTLTWVGEGDPPEGIPSTVLVEPILCGECDPDAECGDLDDFAICAVITAATGAWVPHIGESVLLKYGQTGFESRWSNAYAGAAEALGWICAAGEESPASGIWVACITDPPTYDPGTYWQIQWISGLDPPLPTTLVPAHQCGENAPLAVIPCIPGTAGIDACYPMTDSFTVTLYRVPADGSGCPPSEEMAAALATGRRRARTHRRAAPATGPGAKLKGLLRSVGIASGGCDGCGGMASQMNEWGPAGCRARREQIAGRLREQAGRRGWLVTMAAAGRAVASGLAFRLNPLDPFGSLVDEAIRLAEAESPPVCEDGQG